MRKLPKRNIIKELVLLAVLMMFTANKGHSQLPVHVKVAEGWIQGTTENGLTVFRGIPFAAPPVGDLRWKGPQPVKKWDGVKQASHFAASPMQGGNPSSGKSEDCLYLNVWTPAKSKSEHLPVMVWIYGGGFGSGSTSDPWFDGQKLAQKGAVFVSIAYRVGPLGFLAHPALSDETPEHTSGNYGLLDQIAGLKWVQKNIVSFGGDPQKVTIFGESAGGISVSMLCASPLAKGLFRGAISQSGGSFGPTGTITYPGENMKTLKLAESDGTSYAAKAGAVSIEELRKMEVDKLPMGWGVGSSWPIVDGYVIPDIQYKLYQEGKYNDVPVLIGYNSDEGLSFSPGKTSQEYINGVKTRYGKFADDLIKAYPAGKGSVPRSARNLSRDAAFGWHNWTWVRLQSKTGKSKVFYYFFDQHPNYPEGSPEYGHGSPHAQDVSYVFQHIDPSNPQTSKSDATISMAMGNYWINFAKYGNPNGDGLPKWPEFTADKPGVMHFAETPHMGEVPDEKALKVLDHYFKWRLGLDGNGITTPFNSPASGGHLVAAGRKQLFDYDWKFVEGDKPTAQSRDFDDTGWRSLDLPHDWSIEGKIHPKNPTGNAGGYFPAGIGWYRKTFKVPGEWKNKNVSVYFEGVYMNSEVFINGKSLGVRPYGYSSFSYNLSPYLDFNKENVIAVRVDNSQQINSRWYSGSGIYRHVWLNVTDPLHVAQWGVAITTPAVSAKKATVQIKTRLINETAFPKGIILETQLLTKKAGNAGSGKIKVELAANSEKEFTQTINVANPLLWSPETPNLYKAQIQISSGSNVVDKTEASFGIRSISFTPEKGFQLNGKTMKINGGCVHHDNGCLGAAAFDRAEERKIEQLKAAGFNAVRTSHNPPSEAFLEACDRLGLLVMDESFDGWRVGKNKHDYSVCFDQWWKRDLETMVLRDRNHPSIIMWSIGNEVSERKTPEAVETAKKLVAAVKYIDSTRPVTSAVVTWGEWEAFDPLMAAHDIAGYNYQLHSAPADHKRVPSRGIVQTESYPRDAFANWKLVQNNSYIIGDFVWTAIDYLGEAGIGRSYYSGEVTGENWDNDMFPWHGAYCGDIDLVGWRKPISHYRSILYNNHERLYMAVREPNPEPLQIKETKWSVWPTWESWTWPGFEGRNIDIEVYSKYPKVRLYLSDKLIGEKPTSEEQEFKATFSVPYTPGILKAVGVENDKERESTILQTSGNAAKIKLNADRNEILANGQDLSYVTIEITDKNGISQPNAVNRLHFTIDGPGVVAGVDNADLKDLDQYVGNTRKVWHGKALVVIKSTRNAGDVKLTVTSPDLAAATLTIKTFGK